MADRVTTLHPRPRRTDWLPAMMIPTAWACLCPVCGEATEIDDVSEHGDPALRNAVYRVDDEHRWLRCDGCDNGLEIIPVVVSHPPTEVL